MEILSSQTLHLWWLGTQGLAVGSVPHGARDCERLEWHGENLAVRLLQRATADFLRGGELLSSVLRMLPLDIIPFLISTTPGNASSPLVASRAADWSAAEPQQEQGEGCWDFLRDLQRSCSLHLHAGCPKLVSMSPSVSSDLSSLPAPLWYQLVPLSFLLQIVKFLF